MTSDLESFQFNTVVAALMEYSTYLSKQRRVSGRQWSSALTTLALLLAPICPFISEEIWERSGHAGSIHRARFPDYDPALAAAGQVTLIVQINGKVRARLTIDQGLPAEAQRALAMAEAEKHLQGREARNVIVVPDRLVNVVV